jgi:hypothetical protein
LSRRAGGGRCHNWSVARLAGLLLVAAGALLAASCGGAKRYTLEATRTCLKAESGLLVRKPPSDDFIAKVATRGAMNARFADNQVTITFSEDAAQADNVARGYRRFRGKGVGIESALEEIANVVMIWAVTPQPAEKGVVHGCLKS